MKPLLLLSILAVAGLYACSSAPDSLPPPVNEYLVVGNDKGFRDDYINQANLVTINDSSITVRSLKSVDSYRDYPIVNGYVEGGADPKLHWKMSVIGQDTIALRDTSRQSTFYLRRLARVDSLPPALGLLTSGELKTMGVGRPGLRSNYVFNDMGQSAGCLINRGYFPYTDWTKMSENSDIKAMPEAEYYVRRGRPSSLWRLYTRFAQPILVTKNYVDGLIAVPLDSLSLNGDTLYGHSVSDLSFKSWNDFHIFRADSIAAGLTPSLLATLSAEAVKTEVMPAKARNQHRRRWEKGEDPAKYLTVYEGDLDNLRLKFSGTDRLNLMTGGTELLSRNYRLHPTAPYLIVGEECDNDAYWHYELHGDSVTFRVPLRVEVNIDERQRTTYLDGKGNEVAIPVGRWYALDEWRATYLLSREESR